MPTKKTASSTTAKRTTTRAKGARSTGAATTAKTAKTRAATSTVAQSTASTASASAKAPVQGVTAAEAAPGQVMTKKQLFARLKARTPGVKGSDTRQVMEAMLEELGAALVSGQGLKLQPLGMVKVQRQKAVGGGDMLVLKLRRKKRGPDENDPLAEAAE